MSMKQIKAAESTPPEEFSVKQFHNFHIKRPVLESLCAKVTSLKACNFKKRLQHRCFPVECCQIFKKTYYEEHLQTTVSAVSVTLVLLFLSLIRTLADISYYFRF